MPGGRHVCLPPSQRRTLRRGVVRSTLRLGAGQAFRAPAPALASSMPRFRVPCRRPWCGRRCRRWPATTCCESLMTVCELVPFLPLQLEALQPRCLALPQSRCLPQSMASLLTAFSSLAPSLLLRCAACPLHLPCSAALRAATACCWSAAACCWRWAAARSTAPARGASWGSTPSWMQP